MLTLGVLEERLGPTFACGTSGLQPGTAEAGVISPNPVSLGLGFLLSWVTHSLLR